MGGGGWGSPYGQGFGGGSSFSAASARSSAAGLRGLQGASPFGPVARQPMGLNDFRGGNGWANGRANSWGQQQGLANGWGQQGANWGQGRGGGIANTPYRRYDRSYLAGLVPSAPPRVSGRAGPLSQDALRYSQTFASADAQAAAQSMIGASSSDAVAQGIVDAASRSSNRDAIADAMASAAAMNRGATANVLTRSANYALLRGQTTPFVDACSDAFLASRRQGSIKHFGLAMADALQQGGTYGQYTYGQAIAKAVAQGSDGQAAVAEATAEVFCQGGSYANAWSSAFAIALNQDQNGCLVLSKARALAVSSCGGGAFNSYADSDSTSKVLGFCGLMPPGTVPGFSFNSNDSGSNTWGGK